MFFVVVILPEIHPAVHGATSVSDVLFWFNHLSDCCTCMFILSASHFLVPLHDWHWRNGVMLEWKKKGVVVIARPITSQFPNPCDRMTIFF